MFGEHMLEVANTTIMTNGLESGRIERYNSVYNFKGNV
jgi:hypothetical protein